MNTRQPPLVAHVIHALRTGGLENGVVNLINQMPSARYRHAVVCLDGYDDFAHRIQRSDVPVVALHKKPGNDPALYGRLWRTFRRLQPAIVHTRNLGALEAQLPAWLTGVRGRVHGEHGRDMADLAGRNERYRRIRQALRPLIHSYIPLSRDLEDYLHDRVGVPRNRITRIINGVDTDRFHPDHDGAARNRLLAAVGWSDDSLVVGWVGRMEPVKNPLGLITAFARLCTEQPRSAERTRLVMIGGGTQQAAVERAVAEHGLGDRVWLTGPRDDVAELLRGLDLFVLPSLAEGISNTILEALASGLPVVATAVGGNAELVVPDDCGVLVPADDPGALAAAIDGYQEAEVRLTAESWNARARAREHFSLQAMVDAYMGVYDRVLSGRGAARVNAERAGETV